MSSPSKFEGSEEGIPSVRAPNLAHEVNVYFCERAVRCDMTTKTLLQRGRHLLSKRTSGEHASFLSQVAGKPRDVFLLSIEREAAIGGYSAEPEVPEFAVADKGRPRELPDLTINLTGVAVIHEPSDLSKNPRLAITGGSHPSLMWLVS
jgi:hypothetical protein